MLQIAGISLPISEPDAALAELGAVYAELDQRLTQYAADARNTVLCRVGCSHCCRSGGFFAVSLVEALRVSRAVAELPHEQREVTQHGARELLNVQRRVFANGPGEPDAPGTRDEELFSRRVSTVVKTGAACALLEGDFCSIYAARPFLCRAYGYATDAYAVEAAGVTAFRSLCVLYENVHLRDFVRAKELRAALATISHDLAGRNVGRFTIAEAILAREQPDA